ncbi:MAG: hypothetical protein PHP41_04090 [Bacilli bacterium]|nr:hypothetical protein [Bacilli bacterium]
MNVYNFIIATEMLLANIYVTHICSKKRFALWKTISILFVFYILYFVLFWAIRTFLPPIPEGSGILLFTGFLFIIPLFLVYNQDIRYTILIMVLSWLYTTVLFSLSLILAKMIDSSMLLLLGAVIQSILLIATYPLFVGYVKNKLYQIIVKMDRPTLRLLTFLTLLAFFIISLQHIRFFTDEHTVLPLLITVLFALFIFLLYRLFYMLASSKKKMGYLRNLLSKEWLSTLKGPEALRDDITDFEKSEKPFTLINMKLTLRGLKDQMNQQETTAINQYMRIVSGMISVSATLYRIDEKHFIVIETAPDVKPFIEDVKEIRFPDLENIKNKISVFNYPIDKNGVLYFLNQLPSN